MDSTLHHSVLRFASSSPVRLDTWLGERLPEHSRSQWQVQIKAGRVRVNGEPRKPHYGLKAGDTIEVERPAPRSVEIVPEDIPLDILFEDADLLVVNKPAGLVVHPAPGHDSGTLVNALLHHCRDLDGIGGEKRPGLVHRLDKDTTGALVVAKTEKAMASLAKQFKGRRVRKQYAALVWGRPEPAAGTITTLVGRNPHDRKKMSARPASGREAVTHYETVKGLGPASLLRVRIETGRTHQIRVHLAHIGHPVVGDRQYGRARNAELPAEAGRQMLHAEHLAFRHPRTHEPMEFTAPLPADMAALLRALSRAK